MRTRTNRNPNRAASPHGPCPSQHPRRVPAAPSRWLWDPDRVIGVASAATLVFAWMLL